MYNFFPFLIAKRQLKDNGIESTPTGLLIGLMPGMKVPMLQQFILNKAVVDGEIAIKEKDDANLNKGTSDQKLNELKTGIDAATKDLLPSTSQADLFVAVNKIRALVDLEPVPLSGITPAPAAVKKNP